ncbi:hypothetical protein Tco_1414906, partial [Tanacetum coccineum]
SMTYIMSLIASIDKRNDTLASYKHTGEENFTLKHFGKEAQASDTRIATWTISHNNDPTVKDWYPMIERNEGCGLKGACNKLGDREASLSCYKYKGFLTHKQGELNEE